jgi:signal transduction histidine kinase/DNA-binding response OmpR family regulator
MNDGMNDGMNDETERLRGQLEAVRQQQAATSEVLRALGRSVSDIDAVLGTVVESARSLCRADVAQIHLLEDEIYRLVRSCGLSDEGIEYMSRNPVGRDRSSLIGRVGLYGRTQQITDVLADPDYGRLDLQRLAGLRTVLGVPMLLDEELIGVLLVWRTRVDPFGHSEAEALTTFAAQAAIAIRQVDLLRALERKSAELEVASEHKSDFLASMSHELRTPLNAVIGFSEVLLERMFGELNERQEEYLRDIWASGRHLLELLNDILDLSKVEAGHMVLERTTFPVQSTLEYGLSLIRERAARNRIGLALEVAPDVRLLDADELRYKQVLLNLLSNAVKFTGEGGQVAVRAYLSGQEVVVTVTDTGIGVDEADRERIFESFQQGGRSAARTEGTGLGLTLSKRIVELHGGRIWLESEVGVGSTFGFAVPVGLTTPAEFSGPQVVGSVATSGARVVVVEDDRASMELLTLYLTGAGADVVPAGDGEEGLDLIRRVHPAAVVLDIRLPKLDGWDLLGVLKSDPVTAPIPVIVVSMLDERGKGFALGAADYLVKPVGREDVVSAVSRVTTLPGRARIVVAIDDDPFAVELVRAVLEPEGWTVLGATTGEAGVALVRDREPAVVLLDLLMPGMDGFAVVDELRRESSTHDVPVVILTSKTMTADEKSRLAGRISYFASKADFDSSSLVELVSRVASMGEHSIQGTS